jgi:hypothetical protein
MPAIQLKIEQLVLDNDNPRITHSDGQHQALQKVVRDQKVKLVRLAESIVEHGLSPIEKFMVLEVSDKPRRFIALEGNRRVTALRLLTNPTAMTGLDMPDGMQRAMERLAKIFDKSKIEPIDCYEVESREDGRYWIELRHNGEDQGRGVVDWKPIVAARFREREPAIQAFDLVIEHGGFNEDEAEALRSGFPLTTLRRLIESPDVRERIGLALKSGRLFTDLPGSEVIKPLRRMVLDLASKEGQPQSRRLNKKEQMIAYVDTFGKEDKPDLGKRVPERPIDGLDKSDFARSPKKASRSKGVAVRSKRTKAVPNNCPVHITDNRIGEIFDELRRIKLEDGRNAIAVLLRVFLELSIDHFLENNGGTLTFVAPNGRTIHKSLDKKLAEVVDMLVKSGVPRSHFAQVIRSLSVDTSPMNIDLFHRYVHDRFATPSPGELTAAWDHAQPLFEKIWP